MANPFKSILAEESAYKRRKQSEKVEKARRKRYVPKKLREKRRESTYIEGREQQIEDRKNRFKKLLEEK